MTLVRLQDDDFREVVQAIFSFAGTGGRFDVVYEHGDYDLTLAGYVLLDYTDCMGDGIFTPQEYIMQTEIVLEDFECRGEDGLMADIDLDIGRLQSYCG